MKFTFSLLFIFGYFLVFGQMKHGTIRYNGRVTTMYQNGTQIEIPYEQQNTREVLAEVAFDTLNVEVDLLATIVYSLNVTHQKQNDWLLYQERYGSDRTVVAAEYDSIPVFTFDNVQLDLDTVRNIAGYWCNLAKYELDGIGYEAWFSEDFDIGSNLLPVPQEIPGACLEFTVRIEIADVKYTAYDVNSSAPNPNKFEMILQYGYEFVGRPPFPVQEVTPKKLDYQSDEVPPPPLPVRVEER